MSPTAGPDPPAPTDRAKLIAAYADAELLAFTAGGALSQR